MSHFRLCRMNSWFAVLITQLLCTANPLGAQENDRLKVVQDAGVPSLYRQGAAKQLAFDRDADVLVATIRDQGDEILGATLQPVGDTLRAQLGIPAAQGLLVVSLREDGPSACAGLKQNDVLLSIAEKPLAAAEDLTKQLKAAGDSALLLNLLRAGKQVTLKVRPVYRVTLGPAAEKKTEYFIGISLEPTDDPLRAQLALPAGQGVVITDVIAGSPAEKAGVKKHDIVLELGGKPMDNAENLAHRVQATQDTPTTLKILRGGKTIVIPVTPAVRIVEDRQAQEERYRLFLADLMGANARMTANAALRLAAPAGTDDVRGRLDRLEKELQAIRTTLDRINEAIKGGSGAKRD